MRKGACLVLLWGMYQSHARHHASTLPCSDHVAQGTDRGPGLGAMTLRCSFLQQNQVDLLLDMSVDFLLSLRQNNNFGITSSKSEVYVHKNTLR
jgi:hypothetical protein